MRFPIHFPCFLAAICSLPLVVALVGLRVSASEAPRATQSLDENWRFHPGSAPDAVQPGYDDSTWRRVDVPHDYVIEGAFAQTNPFPQVTIGRADDWYPQQGSLPVQAV